MNHAHQLIPALMLFAGSAMAGPEPHEWEVPRASEAPVIDGLGDEASWELAEWRQMNQLMWGSAPEPEDFSGRYKLLWTPDALWLLAEITDDILIDSEPDPLERYWEDDALEFFLDEDASGGIHQYNYSAFAQHIALDNQSVDIGPYLTPEDEAAGILNKRTFPDMVTSRWRRDENAPHVMTWEVKITVFGDDYHDDPNRSQASAVVLEQGKTLGFMLAYCDADSPEGREHFLGDIVVEPVNGDRNRGYIDASVFGRISLAE